MDLNKKEHSIYKYTEDVGKADAVAWAFTDKDSFEKFPFTFPELKKDEIRANILYAGLCLSDSKSGRSKWGPANYPLAPGHEIIAEVSEVGEDVKDFKKGEKVAFGTLRKVCESCKYCNIGKETPLHWVGISRKNDLRKILGRICYSIATPCKFFL